MNLLVTNTRATQALHIIRALRPHAEKIVATVYGRNRFEAGLSHAARSRLVDKRYHVPSPVEDWRAGRIQKQNTDREEAYVQAVIRLCEKERIDTIFPSFDPQVYVFSKNKARFEKLGIVIPVPDYETAIVALDKYRTIRAAQQAGFPCPKTYLPESAADLKRAVEEIEFPLVIKPRFTSGGRGTEIVKNFRDLETALSKSQQIPMIQQFIPGREKQQFYLAMDKAGRLKTIFCPKTHRIFFRLHRNSSAASESAVPHDYAPHAVRLARDIGWWSGLSIQTKIDARDGIPKLLEMNPRLGHHLWYMTGLGVNVPLMCVKIARGEEVETATEYPAGVMFVSPVEDLLGLGYWALDHTVNKFRTVIFGEQPLDPLNVPLTPKEMFHSFKRTYFNGNQRVFDPYFRYCLSDPTVSSLWWGKCVSQLFGALKHLGE